MVAGVRAGAGRRAERPVTGWEGATFRFLWSVTGRVRLPNALSDAAALERVEAMLRQQHKPVTERGANHLVFCEPLQGWLTRRGSNWATLLLMDRGRIWTDHDLEGRALRYEFGAPRAFVFCLVACALFCAFSSAVSGLRGGLVDGAIAFAWLYGANAALAAIRVPLLFRRAIRGEPRSPPRSAVS